MKTTRILILLYPVTLLLVLTSFISFGGIIKVCFQSILDLPTSTILLDIIVGKESSWLLKLPLFGLYILLTTGVFLICGMFMSELPENNVFYAHSQRTVVVTVFIGVLIGLLV